MAGLCCELQTAALKAPVTSVKGVGFAFVFLACVVAAYATFEALWHICAVTNVK